MLGGDAAAAAAGMDAGWLRWGPMLVLLLHHLR
jgi:hypothetical protein